MTDHAVLIVGGGPTGLMLAAELTLSGVDVAVVERRASHDVVGSRASGLHARTIEVLDQRGIADRFIAEGKKYPVVGFHGALDIGDFPTRHNYVLAIWQKEIERILSEWVAELGVTFYRQRDVTGFTQHDAGIEITLADGGTMRAEYLVGCDGGRSVIRKAAGIDFAGWDATTSWLTAEATMRDEPPLGFREDARGKHAIGRLDDGRVRVVLEEPATATGDPTPRDVSGALVASYGTDFGIHDVTWVSRFTDVARQAVAYRARRVLLAGDAAHVHAPVGGQGLNIGVQDAVNLGWKLGQVVARTAPATLLDSYHAERHPVAARALQNTMAQMALRRSDDRSKALGGYVADFLRMDGPRRRMVGEMSGLDIRYDIGEGHPLLGRRVPDLDLVTADGPRRLFTLLHDARPVLIDLGAPQRVDIAPWADRVRAVDAEYGGTWELPVIGAVSAPDAMLIRPDGHVAWVGEGDSSRATLVDALTRWFGPPAHGDAS